jgi:hypothetical protein
MQLAALKQQHAIALQISQAIHGLHAATYLKQIVLTKHFTPTILKSNIMPAISAPGILVDADVLCSAICTVQP